MARPPQEPLPGTESADDNTTSSELPTGAPGVEARRSRRLFGPPLDGRVEPRFNPAQLSDDTTSVSSTDEPKSTVPPPPSLGSIAGPDLARDPFSYSGMTSSQDSGVTFSKDRNPKTLSETPLNVRAPQEPQVLSTQEPRTDSLDVWSGAATPDETTDFNPDGGRRPTEGTRVLDRASPFSRSQMTEDQNRNPMRRMPRDDAPRLSRPRFDPPSLPQRERPTSTRSLQDLIPADARVTRHVSDATASIPDPSENRRPLDLPDRAERGFDSASDEALTKIDPSVPPLVVGRPIDDLIATRTDVRLSPPLNRDWERGDAMDPMDALTSRVRHRAMDDTERLNARRNEAIVDQARDAISIFGMKVDEVRVARAEARFKPKAPSVEDLIAQSRVDAIEEEQALLEAEEELYDAPLVARRYELKAPRFLKQGLLGWFRGRNMSPETRVPQVQRVNRRKRQSRLYEDIIAWIVVPPFIIGMIYGILELSKLLANSPIGKLLSGQ